MYYMRALSGALESLDQWHKSSKVPPAFAHGTAGSFHCITSKETNNAREWQGSSTHAPQVRNQHVETGWNLTNHVENITKSQTAVLVQAFALILHLIPCCNFLFQLVDWLLPLSQEATKSKNIQNRIVFPGNQGNQWRELSTTTKKRPNSSLIALGTGGMGCLIPLIRAAKLALTHCCFNKLLILK